MSAAIREAIGELATVKGRLEKARVLRVEGWAVLFDWCA